jgi:superoxide dismutase, Fe-Mn family
MFALPALPFAYDAFAPVISERAMRLHHDRHHRGYLLQTNDLLGEGTDAALETVIANAAPLSDRRLFNNASQAWNHSFFWSSMAPVRSSPIGALRQAVGSTFGDIDGMKQAFVRTGLAHFGAGWLWLFTDNAGGLDLQSTHDATSALSFEGKTPLLVCDLWEHAYYLDHQNDRAHFLEGWFDTASNWTFAASQFSAANNAGEVWRHPPPANAGKPAFAPHSELEKT